jgi:hypothetical protein
VISWTETLTICLFVCNVFRLPSAFEVVNFRLCHAHEDWRGGVCIGLWLPWGGSVVQTCTLNTELVLCLWWVECLNSLTDIANAVEACIWMGMGDFLLYFSWCTSWKCSILSLWICLEYEINDVEIYIRYYKLFSNCFVDGDSILCALVLSNLIYAVAILW